MLRSKGIGNSSSLCFHFPLSRAITQIGPGKQVVFVTNNSTKSRADYKEKLESMGIPAEIVSPLRLCQPSP